MNEKITIIVAAVLMEGIDPGDVFFENGKFTAVPGQFPHIDNISLENINKHFSFLITTPELRDDSWIEMWQMFECAGKANSDDIPTIEKVYLTELLKTHNYHDRHFNPAEPAQEPSAIQAEGTYRKGHEMASALSNIERFTIETAASLAAHGYKNGIVTGEAWRNDLAIQSFMETFYNKARYAYDHWGERETKEMRREEFLEWLKDYEDLNEEANEYIPKIPELIDRI